MTSYKICVNDRSYSSWEIFDANNLNKVNLDINPIDYKLLSNDVFTFDILHNKFNLLHSNIRSGPPIPAVLILDGNKTYGRQDKIGKGNKKESLGKLLYKCIPDDIRLPSFLVPYEIKNMGFLKVFKNLYVTITFDSWNDKHPRAKLDNVIGPVDILDNFYEYQLYCKSLNSTIHKFQKETSKTLENRSQEGIIRSIKQKYPSIQDRTNQKLWYILTIDPPKSVDYDDGFSIIEHENNIYQLSIYISNVTIWIDYLNLWDSFSRRISTIYLPDKKRPMLPTILSDCLCSLQENVTRIAFVMDIFIQNDEIIDVKYSNCFIKVFKNYCYEEPNLLANNKYKLIFDLCQNLSVKNNYINNINNINNSHEVVSYLMILMNYQCAKELIKYKTGIFRSTSIKSKYVVPETLPLDVGKFIKIINSASGQYINGAEIMDTRHEILDMDAYIHITSPIRRIVDILNIIKFQQVFGIIKLSDDVDIFYNKWLYDIEYINITMRSIRKIQYDCSLLDLCHNDNELLNKEYDGYLFDKIHKKDDLYQFVVFLPELKLSSMITIRDNCDNFECKKFKLYLFNNEIKFKKKIRLQML